MSKIFSVYSNNVDRVWYQSSNVKYSECVDKNGELKTLRVVFNNGAQYEYAGVDVNQYLMFREDLSQGKALNKYIKGNEYEYTKLEDADLDAIESELNFRMEGGYFVKYDGYVLKVLDNKDTVLYEKEIGLTKDAFDVICDIIRTINGGHDIHVDGGERFHLLYGVVGVGGDDTNERTE